MQNCFTTMKMMRNFGSVGNMHFTGSDFMRPKLN